MSDNCGRKGYGSMMLNKLIHEASKNQLGGIHLSVDVGNVVATRMYEKLGFQKIDAESRGNSNIMYLPLSLIG